MPSILSSSRQHLCNTGLNKLVHFFLLNPVPARVLGKIIIYIFLDFVFPRSSSILLESFVASAEASSTLSRRAFDCMIFRTASLGCTFSAFLANLSAAFLQEATSTIFCFFASNNLLISSFAAFLLFAVSFSSRFSFRSC